MTKGKRYSCPQTAIIGLGLEQTNICFCDRESDLPSLGLIGVEDPIVVFKSLVMALAEIKEHFTPLMSLLLTFLLFSLIVLVINTCCYFSI